MNLHQRRVYSQNIEGVLATTANQFKSKQFLKYIVGTYLILVCFLSAYVFKLDFFFLNENGNIFLFSISTNMCIFALVDFLIFFFKNEKQRKEYFFCYLTRSICYSTYN